MPSFGNGPVQKVMVDDSIRHKWVKGVDTCIRFYTKEDHFKTYSSYSCDQIDFSKHITLN